MVLMVYVKPTNGKMNFRHNLILKILTVSVFLFVFVAPGFGQHKRKTKNNSTWSASLNFGPNIFMGDLRVHNFVPASTNKSEWGWGYGGTLDKQLGDVFSARGQLLMATAKGTKRVTHEYFKADIFEYSLQLNLDLTNLAFPDKRDKIAYIYGYTGLGFSNWRTNVYNLYTDKALRGNGHNGKGPGGRTTEVVFPFGGGIKMFINKKWNIYLESSFRILNSDKLDATIGGSKHDMYNYSSIGITYNLFKKVQKKPASKNEIASSDKPSFDVRYDIPVRTPANGEFEMKLIVDRGPITGGGTFSQILPAGFKATDPNVMNGVFSFADQQVSISFDKIPEVPSFTLTYKVKVSDLAPGTYPIIGEFVDADSKSYQFNNNIYVEKMSDMTYGPASDTLSVSTASAIKGNKSDNANFEYRVQIRASYGQMTPDEELNRYKITDKVKEDYVNGWYKYSVGSFKTYREAAKYRDLLISNNGINDAFVVKFKNGKPYTEPIYGSGKETATTEAIMNAESKSKIYETPWEKGTEFRVQIAASGGKISKVALARQYGITQPIMEDYGNGWYRYSVGSYKKYWQARELRNVLISKNGIGDAFVVGFRNGQRLNSLSELVGSTGTTSGSHVIKESGRVFKVQILALRNKKENTIEELKSRYNIKDSITEEVVDGFYQYTVGTFKSMEEAKRYSEELSNKGIKDAFVVTYQNGYRL